MKKRVIAALTVLCILLTAFSATLVVHAEGKPTLDGDGYYLIGTAEELAWFATEVNSGNSEINAKLTANIDLSTICYPASNGAEQANWTPIGNNTSRFTGIFDGQGHTITNLYINNSSQYMGLFGVAAGGSDGEVTIKNVGVSGSISAGNYAAGLVAVGETATLLLIENCHTNVTVNAGQNSAGLLGVSMGNHATVSIKNCLNTGNITGTKESAAISGWLGNNALVRNTYSTGIISGIESGKPFTRMSSAALINCQMSSAAGTQANVSVLENDTLTSGKLAFSLGKYWGQNIDSEGTPDPAPSIGGPTVYAIYGESCLATGYTNVQPSTARPDHTAAYYEGDLCEVCGDYRADSVYAIGLDLTTATEDIIKANYTWSYAEKTLTLDGVSITTAASVGITLPANSKIVLKEGSENDLTVTDPLAIGIYCPASFSIEGKGTLTVNTMGGNIIRCDGPDEDVVLSVKNSTFYGSGGQIYMPKTNQSSQFIVENATLNIGDTCNVYVGGKNDATLDSTCAIIIKNSTTVTGKLGMDANTANGKGIFSITDNSDIKATQASGNAVDSGVNITAYDFDIDIHDSDLLIWTKGHNWGGNSYAFRVNGKHNMDLNISRSDMLLYGYSLALWTDSLSEVSQDSSIEDCTIVNYSKGTASEISINQNDTNNNNYGDENVTDRVVKDNVILMCSNMENSNKNITMQVTGNPVIYRDFTLPATLGSANITESFTGVVLEENQSITIMEGATVTFPESAPIILSKGCTISGDFVGTVKAIEGVDIVVFDYGISKSIAAHENGEIVPKPSQAPSIPNYTLQGYYNDAEFTQPHDFDMALTGNVTVYAKWINKVTYATNDGTDKTDTVEYIYGKPNEATDAFHFREGYQFTGWNTAANGNGAAVAVGTHISFDGTPLTLYAQWKATEQLYEIGTIPSVTYNGSEQKPELSVSYVGGGNANAEIAILSYANHITAGTASITYTLGNDPKTYTAYFTIDKATYDMSGITFEDVTVPYSGAAQAPAISGTLPDGVTVHYSASYTEPGSYTVTATFSGDFANYNEIAPMSATLIIENIQQDDTVLGIVAIVLAVLSFVLAAVFCIRLSRKMKGARLVSVTPTLMLIALPGGNKLWVIIFAVTAALMLLANLGLSFSPKKKSRMATERKEDGLTAASPSELHPAPAQTALTPSSEIKNKAAAADATAASKKTVFVTYKRSFMARLIQGGETMQTRYGTLKNALLSYEKTKSRISWSNDTVRAGRATLAKFAVRGKTLTVYLALDTADYEGSQFGFERAEGKRYEELPLMIRLTSDRKVNRALEAIAAMCRKLQLASGAAPTETYIMPYETDEQLIARGLIKIVSNEDIEGALLQKASIADLIRKQTTAEEAKELISDRVAETLIERKSATVRTGKLKKGVINIDTLSENYETGARVTLDSLKEKQLITRSVSFVKLLARGTLNKPLTVELHDYSMDAVKMILLTGGKVVKLSIDHNDCHQGKMRR